jgi:mannose-1-phosphate guanylyltransferase
MLNEMERFEPEIARAAQTVVGGIERDLDFLHLPSEPFRQAPKKSIDYAVMERKSLLPSFPSISVGRTSEVGAQRGTCSATTTTAMRR